MKKPMMTISGVGRTKYIQLNKYSVQQLGEPQYICMLTGKDKRSLAFTPCREKHVMSFKVQDNFFESRNAEFKICSKRFVELLFEIIGLESGKTYIIEGVYNEERNLIVFPLKVA